MKKTALAIWSVALLTLPQVASAAPRNFKEFSEVVVSIIDTGTGLLILLGIVVYFWGISTNILKMKDEGSQAFKAYVVWGIVAIFVMVSIWGIIELLQNTLFGGGEFVDSADTSVDGGFPIFE